MSSNQVTSITSLNDGKTIPHLGFGLYNSPPDVSQKSIEEAIRCGYRLLDTAQYYENEAQVGAAVKQSGRDRKEFYVVTKMLGSNEASMEQDLASLRKSVEIIGLGYVDLFLIHSPTFGREGRARLFKAMITLQKEGLIHSIGVANFGVKHLQQLKEDTNVTPAVNQVELHPWCQQRDIVDYCEKENIVIQAYCPLVRGEKFGEEGLKKIAEKHKKNPAQVLIRWSLQMGYIPLPKSDNPKRINDNADVFDFKLDDEDMKVLREYDQGSEGAIVAKAIGSDPTTCE
ncbi:hypothetical protein PROFUN_12757 [Planoprotostelium fungivorum]|uniref:NADP-dependent oxidoreductase domain-containing protein n=1 Tax=Planoprotostelium fungivorum TaxID=1890364 RepID=A0A2P6N5J1_9EUKA|nr:hypothetical protein PROFUN_12757 [Planoprotostelium fungivorum]